MKQIFKRIIWSPLLVCVRCASGDSDDGELCSAVWDHRCHRQDWSPFDHENVWPVRLKGEWVSARESQRKAMAVVQKTCKMKEVVISQMLLLYETHKAAAAAASGSLYVKEPLIYNLFLYIDTHIHVCKLKMKWLCVFTRYKTYHTAINIQQITVPWLACL